MMEVNGVVISRYKGVVVIDISTRPGKKGIGKKLKGQFSLCVIVDKTRVRDDYVYELIDDLKSVGIETFYTPSTSQARLTIDTLGDIESKAKAV